MEISGHVRVVLRLAQSVAIAAAACAVLVRLTVQDAFLWSAWIYYATPPPLIAAALVVAAVPSFMLGGRRAGIACLLASFLCAASWWAWSWRGHRCVVTPHELRAMVWNVSRNPRDRNGIPDLVEAVESFQPHVAGFVEAGPNSPAYLERWRAAFPGYTVSMPRENLAVLWQGSIERQSWGSLAGISHYADLTGTIDGRRLRLLLVDLDASPRFDKRRIVDEVFARSRSARDVPTIVMGDFNTPLDSPSFRAVRRGYHHAFEEAGRGLPPTWPGRLPFLTIDHVWLSTELQPTCTTLVSASGYDHRQVRVRMVPPAADHAPGDDDG